MYLQFYTFVRPYVAIRKHIILQGYHNYILIFMSDVNAYLYQHYELHLSAMTETKFSLVFFCGFAYCFYEG